MLYEVITEHFIHIEDVRLSWTASLGVTVTSINDESISVAMVRADQALYRAKQNGRDRVESDLPEA